MSISEICRKGLIKALMMMMMMMMKMMMMMMMMQYACGVWQVCIIDHRVPESVCDDGRGFLVVDDDWNLLTGWQEMVLIRWAAGEKKNNKVFKTANLEPILNNISRWNIMNQNYQLINDGSTHKGFGMVEFPVLLRKLKICFTFTFFSGSKFWPPIQQSWWHLKCFVRSFTISSMF